MKRRYILHCPAAATSLLFIILLNFTPETFSQSVGIGTSTPNSSAQLDISHTSKGLLIPRMTTGAISLVTNPAKGLMIYDSVKNQLMVNMGNTVSPNWQTIVLNSGWSLNGNTGINPSNQFIGTTDNSPIQFRINNRFAGLLDSVTGQALFGYGAGALSTGYNNVGIGYKALFNNTSGYSNIAIGPGALFKNTIAWFNIGVGDSALYNNVNGFCTAIGSKALFSNTSGSDNNAVGYRSLFSNLTGYGNNAFGYRSLYYNTGGSANTGLGDEALFVNTTGYGNTAIGYSSLINNTDGTLNVSVGLDALHDNSTSLGSYNTGIGTAALYHTSASQYNTAIGYHAAYLRDMGYNNTFIGAFSDAIDVGYYNSIAIGKGATCTGSSQAIIGNSSTVLIGGYVNWSVISDGRFKRNVNENVKGLDFIMKLKPVTYQLNVTAIANKLNEGRGKELDSASKLAIIDKEKTFFTGFVAQEVEQAANDAGFDFSGVIRPKDANDFYRVRYAEFVVPLVKGIQEQQQQIEELKKQNKDQQEVNALLQKQIHELKALIKK